MLLIIQKKKKKSSLPLPLSLSLLPRRRPRCIHIATSTDLELSLKSLIFSDLASTKSLIVSNFKYEALLNMLQDLVHLLIHPRFSQEEKMQHTTKKKKKSVF
jgi:hypothetical protein